MAGEAHRARGNASFAACRYDEALGEYSKAVQASPAAPVHLVNRALCHLRLQQWVPAVADADAALALDPASVKALYLRGVGLLEQGRFDDALEALRRAFALSHQQPDNYAEDINKQILRARRMKWERDEDERLGRTNDLQRYLTTLVEEDRKRKLAAAADEAQRQEVGRAADERLSGLRQLFVNAADDVKRREVPEYLLGNIDFELMRDPVIAPSGITYERASILEHLHRVGHFDPITRARLTEAQLISNLALKSAIDDFLDKNGWAANHV